jgi:pimeloyl-ACP methyl ester carboxylesterase
LKNFFLITGDYVNILDVLPIAFPGRHHLNFPIASSANLFVLPLTAMAKSTRLVKSFSRLLLPVVLLVLGATAGGAIFLVYSTARPLNVRYLVTPDKYGQLSTRAAQVTEETWANKDGSTARGWLLRGADGAPAVILLHKFGADRSYVLNLGVKLNESTNFTILMPDMRGHGENPPVESGSFGGCEAEDAGSAIEFVRNLKTENQVALVGRDLGIFGVEMGAIVALSTAAKDPSVKAVAVDSVPPDSDSLLKASVKRQYPFATFATSKLARLGTYMYYFDGCYQREPVCETARRIDGRNVLLLAGVDAQDYQDSTSKLNRCLAPGNQIAGKVDLSPSGFSIINASMEQSSAYDQRLIDFFGQSLSQ